MNFDYKKIPLWCLAPIILATACNSGIKVYELKTAFDESNVLRYNIEFNTRDSADAQINYWPTHDQSRLLSTGISMNSDQHRFKLVGMLSETEYTYQIMTRHHLDAEFIESEQGEFVTGILPESLPRYNLEVEKGEFSSGFILVRKVVAPASTILLDHAGNLVWYEIRDEFLIKAFAWTAKQTVIALDNTNKINEFDLFGNQIFQLQKGEKNLDANMHHEIRRLANNDILALTHKFTKIDLSSVGGGVNDSLQTDGLIRLDSIGNELWSWDVLDFEDPLKDKSVLKSKQDWGHANAVSETRDGNFIISFRDFNQVWKIDSETGEIIWKLGMNGNFVLEDKNIFYRQHAVHEIDNNHLLMFDNGNLDRQSSRALILKLDETSKEILDINSIFLPDSLFSFKQGSVYKIDGDKFLFCATTKNKIIITNNKGEVIWQLHSTAPHYRAYYLKDIPKQSF